MDFIYTEQDKKNETYQEMKQCPNCKRVVKNIIKVERINPNNKDSLINPESPLGKLLGLFNKKKTATIEKYFYVCDKCKDEATKK